MKIFIQGLVLFRLVLKVAAGRLRAYPKRISYKMILSSLSLSFGLKEMCKLPVFSKNVDCNVAFPEGPSPSVRPMDSGG